VLLAASFPGESEARLRALIQRQIEDAVTQEWPAMKRRGATLTMIPTPLAEALDARRQRILISQSSLNWVKSAGILVQAICTLFAIAMVHSDNRLTAALAVGLFATAAAVCLVMIVAHNRPFTGKISVRPEVLLQVEP
jgi:hypothetical protein